MKVFIMSQFNYLALLWILHSRKLNSCINKIYERALRHAYNDNHSTFGGLLGQDNSMTTNDRNLYSLTIEIYYIVKNSIDSQIMKEIFKLKEPTCNLRSDLSNFMPRKIQTTYYGF